MSVYRLDTDHTMHATDARRYFATAAEAWEYAALDYGASDHGADAREQELDANIMGTGFAALGTYRTHDGITFTVSEVTHAWAVGRNMPGYLPETEPAIFLTWEEAREYLEAEMRYWASEEEESWWQTMDPTDYSSEEEVLEDMPRVEAHVGAIFAVDGPASLCTPGLDTGAYVEDARGITWAWWLERVSLTSEHVEWLEDEA